MILIGLVLLAVLFTTVAPKVSAFWSATDSRGRASRRRTAQRDRRVGLAAAEAAEDDPAFAPDVVKRDAARLFTKIQTAWDAGDRQRLRRLVAPKLMAEWERRLDDFERRGWRNRTQPIGEPTVEYVGLTHRGEHESDRVVVRIEAKLRDYVEDRQGHHIKRAGRLSETTRMREFWTLRRSHGRWTLASIEQGAEGTHALDEQIVATAWSDEAALRDEAMVEQAVSDALPEDVKPAEVADLHFEGDARAAALDLSLADGRFSPDLLEIAARRAVAAWVEAIDGKDAALNRIAEREAAQTLLHPAGSDSRLVVRGLRVQEISVAGLDAAADPPTMTIEVDLRGRRYLEDRATAEVLSGSPSHESHFRERWTLALGGDEAQPWRIVSAEPPAVRAY